MDSRPRGNDDFFEADALALHLGSMNNPSFISPPPPQYDAAHYLPALQSQGFAPLSAATVQELSGAAVADLQALYRT